MFDDESFIEDDFLECLGLDDFLSRTDYGRDRGENPEATEAQRRAVESIAGKIYLKSSSSKKKQDEDAEEIVQFDIMDKPRVLLFQGKAMKKSIHSIITQARARTLFLFNDVLLVTTAHGSSSILFAEKYAIHQVLNLKEISFNPRVESDPNNALAFEIFGPDRSYIFYVDTESDKRIWMEELGRSILALYAASNNIVTRAPGWQHEIIQGSIFSDAYFGRTEALQQHLNREDTIPDVLDDSGMSPLHWAALRGHVDCASALIRAGADVDILNNGLNSPLLLAGAKGHDAVLRLLLEMGADVKLRNLKDRDVLFMGVLYASTTKGLNNILQMLNYQGINFDQQDSTGASPLHECAIRNLHRSVHFLVDAGAQVNVKHGRNGMTPLQLACSLPKPDAETVRSFLEKGAHPNWLDGSGRSAFDIVLAVQTSDNDKGYGNSGTPEEIEAMRKKKEMDQLHQWVLHALPVLLEIVKCGGRYSQESIAKLRPSFQDAIGSARLVWNNAVVPDNFDSFVDARTIIASKKDWIADSYAEHCLLCVEKFTFSNRKHHCRACGILCCSICSSKRLPLSPQFQQSKTPTSPASPNPRISGDRVCDGCFNSLCSQAIARNLALAKAKKNLESLRDDDLSTDDKGSADDVTGKGTKDVSNNRVNDIQNTLGNVGANLEERGEKLEQLAEKSERMENAAMQYNQMAKQLLVQQQQNKASPWRK